MLQSTGSWIASHIKSSQRYQPPKAVTFAPTYEGNERSSQVETTSSFQATRACLAEKPTRFRQMSAGGTTAGRGSRATRCKAWDL